MLLQKTEQLTSCKKAIKQPVTKAVEQSIPPQLHTNHIKDNIKPTRII